MKKICEHCIHNACCSYKIRGLEDKCDRVEIYKQGYSDAVEKAYELLETNKDHPFIGCEDPCLSGCLTEEFIEWFKKSMEEEQ